MTARVYAAMATPFICQSDGVLPAIRQTYRDSTMALLLLKDRMTDWTAKAMGKKYFGRGYACSR